MSRQSSPTLTNRALALGAELRAEGAEGSAAEIERALEGGSTSGEILTYLGAELSRVSRNRSLPSATRRKARELCREVNSLLGYADPLGWVRRRFGR